MFSVFCCCLFSKFCLELSQFSSHELVISIVVLVDLPRLFTTLIGRRLNSLKTVSWLKYQGVSQLCLLLSGSKGCGTTLPQTNSAQANTAQDSKPGPRQPGLEVIKLEFILRLKIKRNDWLLADTCLQAANHLTLFRV